MGDELGVPLELAGLVEQTFVRAQAVRRRAWSSQVVKLLEDAVGTDLRAGFRRSPRPGCVSPLVGPEDGREVELVALVGMRAATSSSSSTPRPGSVGGMT